MIKDAYVPFSKPAHKDLRLSSVSDLCLLWFWSDVSLPPDVNIIDAANLENQLVLWPNQ